MAVIGGCVGRWVSMDEATREQETLAKTGADASAPEPDAGGGVRESSPVSSRRRVLIALLAMFAVAVLAGMACCAAGGLSDGDGSASSEHRTSQGSGDASGKDERGAADKDADVDADGEPVEEPDDSSVDTAADADAGAKSDAASAGDAAQQPSPSQQGDKRPASSGGAASSSGAPASKPQHTHTWVPQTTTIHHEAQYQTVHHEAVYDYRSICNGCQADITGNVDAHMQDALLNGNTACGAYHTESVLVSSAWDEQVLVSSAWDETVTTGSVCSGCGAAQ